jgi:hypothetical protein
MCWGDGDAPAAQTSLALCALVAPCKLSSLPHKDRKSKLEMGTAEPLNRDL